LAWRRALHPLRLGGDQPRQGRDPTQPERQKYRCTDCGRGFDELSGTVFAGHHQPLRIWVVCLYFMGLNLSNRPIAQALGFNKDDAQRMTQQVREGIGPRHSSAARSRPTTCTWSLATKVTQVP